MSQNWSIQQREGQNQSTCGHLRIIPLNPVLNCSLTNPLYKHKTGVERLVRDKRFNLTDSRLADLCNIGDTTAYRWRWERHRIPTFHDQWGQYRAVYNGYSWIKLPKDYGNPYARKLKRSNTMREHWYVMEQYLSQHPELSLYRDCLLNGKYLKTDLYCSSC